MQTSLTPYPTFFVEAGLNQNKYEAIKFLQTVCIILDSVNVLVSFNRIIHSNKQIRLVVDFLIGANWYLLACKTPDGDGS